MACAGFGSRRGCSGNKKSVVIIGGSFGGLQVAKELCGDSSFFVTIVDAKDFFEFTPSLHTALGSERQGHKSVLQCHFNSEWFKRSDRYQEKRIHPSRDLEGR